MTNDVYRNEIASEDGKGELTSRMGDCHYILLGQGGFCKPPSSCRANLWKTLQVIIRLGQAIKLSWWHISAETGERKLAGECSNPVCQSAVINGDAAKMNQ